MAPAHWELANADVAELLLWPSGAGHRHFFDPDLRGFLRPALVGIERVGGEHEERAALRSTEGAGDRHRVEGEAFGNLAAIAHAKEFFGHRRGDPDGALFVQRDAIGNGLTDVREEAAIGER